MDQSIKSDLTKIQSEIGIGFWVWNTKTNKLYWDDGMMAIFEIDSSKFTGDFSEYSSRVMLDDLVRIQGSIDLLNGGDFINVFRTMDSFGKPWKYIKAYGSFIESNKDVLAGVNIEIPKTEYYKQLESEIEDIEVIRNYAARRSLFSLKQKFVNPNRFEPIDSSGEWADVSREAMLNSKYRVLSQDKTSHLVTEWMSMNGSMDSHYHLDDELITNLGDSPIDVWVNGEYTQLKNKDSIFIPHGQFHKIKCYGVCHWMSTWFNYYFKQNKLHVVDIIN